MHELLLKLIEDRGTDVAGTKALQAQVILDGGVQVAGAISWEGDHYRALSLVATGPNHPAQMVEFFFQGESVRTIITPADEGTREAYDSLVSGRSKGSRIVAPS